MLDKPIWKSITAWGLLIFGAAEAACAANALPGRICHFIGILGQILVFFGIRRAQATTISTVEDALAKLKQP